MLPQGFLLYGLLLPGLLAGALLLAAWRRRGDAELRAPRAFAGALALAGGFALAFAAGRAPPPFPPHESTGGLFWSAIAALLAACAALAVPQPIALSLRFAACALVPWLLLRNFAARWDLGRTVLVFAALALLLAAAWSLCERWAARRRGASIPLALWITSAGGAAALLFANSAKLALLSASFAAIAGAALVASWLRPSLSLARGGAGAAALILGSLWLAGSFVADLPPSAALLLAFAPAAGLLGEGGRWAAFTGARGVLARAVLVLVPVAGAVLIAWLASPPLNVYDS
jgi:hypothetical protein